MKSKRMASSSLRHRLLIQQEQEASDGAGGYTRSWSDVGYVWAEIRPIRGTERLFADKLQAKHTHKIRLRYRNDITPRHRLVFETRIFSIHSIANPFEMDNMLEIIVTEGEQD